MKHLILIIALLSILPQISFSQENEQPKDTTLNKKVIVVLRNGEEVRGLLVGQDENAIQLEVPTGELTINRSNISQILNDDYTGKFPFPNPHDTRYFFGPTGIPIKKGMGYYQNLMIVGHFANYGIGKHFSIGGGFETISLFAGQPIVFLTPKVGFSLNEYIHIAGGVFYGYAFRTSFGIGYVSGTIGTPETNLSVGFGYGFFDGDTNPLVMISGQHRVSKGVSLMSENYIIPTSTEVSLLGIQGVRLLSEKNAFDIGLGIYPGFLETGIPIPFVGYARVFGKHK